MTTVHGQGPAEAIPRLQSNLVGLAAGQRSEQAKAGAVLLELIAHTWEETAASAVPPIHDQPPGPAAIAVAPRGPVVVAPAEEADVDLAAELDGIAELEPALEHEAVGELTVIRPHPDIATRWTFQPRANGRRWRVLTTRWRSDVEALADAERARGGAQER